jgi:hypothetical protein
VENRTSDATFWFKKIIIAKTADISALQLIPHVYHKFYHTLPHHEETGKRKKGQKVISGE